MKPVFADAASIALAAELLEEGRLVAFPTETVYGLGADASNPDAVKRIFTAKGRPADHPLIVHVGGFAGLSDWAAHVPEAASLLAAHFWPGPLTLILNKKPDVPLVVTGGQQTVGLRVPNHPVALQLLAAFGGGIAAQSANRFCRISPTRAEHVEEELGDAVDLILDGGPCQVGLESTIIDLSRKRPRLLRPGGISRYQIEELLQTELELPRQSFENGIRAPGMMGVHYAPATPAHLCSPERLEAVVDRFAGQNKRIGILFYNRSLPSSRQLHRIIMPPEAEEYAKKLYAALRELDHRQLDLILVERPPETEAWRAVHDRLRKAALPL